ncbi:MULTISPECIES: hypothetical protein [unclassified Roseobacter]|uniref:hypothetical protein n=1 Tax=unclassified Roseobacter TaxID=196798 RepID=UPI0014910364|nr:MULTISPECIES: hypothetical protein [unclassified Roseobacter]NNW55468.1 hypothetical protein [Roseobacter sp. HKCCD8284]NNY17291.1 hypothetical protein [Roseobacter sp. HKCCD8191]
MTQSIRLTHWSFKPLEPLRSVTNDYSDRVRGPFKKPNGFWLSDETDDMSWSNWCEMEEFNRGNIRTDFEVDLTNVLHLSSYLDISDFDNEYNRRRADGLSDGIDWPAVGQKFSGLLITPYNWEARLKFNWYYTWDCASGVFWNTSCLTRLKTSEQCDE